MNKIIRVFLNVDMRNQHNGLTRVAANESVDLLKIKPHEHVIFINTRKNKLKMFSTNGVLSYVMAKEGMLNLAMIEQIPRCFNQDSTLDWNKAQRLALEKQLGKIHE